MPPVAMALLLLNAATAWWEEPVVPLARIAGTADPQPASPSAGKIRPFLVQPGYLIDNPWLGAEEPQGPDLTSGPDWLTLAVGNDLPCFGPFRSGAPGGAGFTRLASQVQLFDDSQSALAFNFGAVAPSGQQNDGVPESRGATVLMPALSAFHALDDATGLMLSVGTNVTLPGQAAGPGRHELQYGLGVYRSLDPYLDSPLRQVFFSVEALGQQRSPRDLRSPVTWDVLPGLHWQPMQNVAVSGGLTLPFSPRTEGHSPAQQWQVRCLFQF
jgi:hypothetical protein